MAEIKARVELLNDKRQAAANSYRDLHKLAEDAKRELSGDEKTKAEEIWNDIRSLDEEIKREEKLAEGEKRGNELSEERKAKFAAVGDDKPVTAQAQAAKAWAQQWQRFTDPGSVSGVKMEFGPQCRSLEREVHRLYEGSDEVRGLSSEANSWEPRSNELAKAAGTGGGQMGYTVPTTTSDRIIMHVNAASGVLECPVTKLNTSTGETMYFAGLTTDATAAIGADVTAATQGYPVMAQRQLDAYDMNVYFYVSKQLLADSAADIEAFVGDLAGRSIATLLAGYYAIGTGSSQPQGINHTSPVTTLGVTTASPTTITYEELIKLYLAVLPGYRKQGDWLFGDLAYSDLVLSKNEEGDFYYRPGDPLVMRPVHIESQFPANTAGLIPVCFGDMSTFYVRNVGGVVIERDDSFAFTSRMATYLCYTRTDSELMDRTGSVKHLIMHA